VKRAVGRLAVANIPSSRANSVQLNQLTGSVMHLKNFFSLIGAFAHILEFTAYPNL
jgi:hypothetical protein